MQSHRTRQSLRRLHDEWQIPIALLQLDCRRPLHRQKGDRKHYYTPYRRRHAQAHDGHILPCAERQPHCGKVRQCKRKYHGGMFRQGCSY